MKILIAILSCRQHADFQQAQRDTWVKDVPSDIDVRYFVGHPDIVSDEVFLGEDAIRPESGLKLYPTLPAKTKLLCKWALDAGYDYVFKTDTDTLVNVENLLVSGFANSDYSGGYNYEETGDFASGGAGYWLSRRAMQNIVDSAVVSWAEDLFVSLALREKGIFPVWNTGYRWRPHEPIDSSMITLHLSSVLQRGKYDPAWMYECYYIMRYL
jgi:hypothetical protein